MRLLLDAGNTRIKWALADSSDQLLTSGFMYYGDVNSVFRRIATETSDVEFIGVSSVVDEKRNSLITRACLTFFDLKPAFVNVSSTACGVENRYKTLDRLGVDRWVAAMGAASNKGVNRVLIDAGTAVTVDLLDANQVFCGGVILPGAKLMHDSLVGETAGIYSEMQSVTTVLGVTTQECVNAGVRFGLVGAVDRVVKEMYTLKSNDRPWQIMICGGDANKFKDVLDSSLPIAHVPNLLFFGLLNLYNAGEFK